MVVKVETINNLTYHHSIMYITMSRKKIEQYGVIKRSLKGELTVEDVSNLISLSERHVYRLRAEVKKEGPKALVHKNKGKESNNKVQEKTRKKIVGFFDNKKHQDFKPGFTAEKLKENHHVHRSSETIRKIMIEEGIWKPKTKKTVDYRSRRKRKGHYGEMIQFDGSYHDWFEKGKKCCLLAGVDDSTGIIVHARFVKNENLQDISFYWNEYFLSHGKPFSIYLDKFSTYYNNLTENKKENLTQFQRMMKETDVKPIVAHSPQAKGRVERLFNTLQDRLIKEMRLKNIFTEEKANRYLVEEFLPEFNEKYGKDPLEKGNFHKKVSKEEKSLLPVILSKQSERLVQNDFCIRFKSRTFQLTKKQPSTVRKKERIIVEERMDGSMRIRLGDKYLNYKEIPPERESFLSEKDVPWILPANTKKENKKVEARVN